MKRQQLQQGVPLRVDVQWYDNVPEPPGNKLLEGEVIGWTESQIVVRVKEYAVLRFWKDNGFECGNRAISRRGYRINPLELEKSTKPAPGISVPLMEEADGEMPKVPSDTAG